MINQEKVKDMTKMAVYEKHGGDKDLHVSSFRRSDYVAVQLIKSFILGTVSYLIILLFFLLVHEDIIEALNTIDSIQHFVIITSSLYIAFLAVYLVLTFIWARYKYKYSSERVESYKTELNRVARSYQGPEDSEQ